MEFFLFFSASVRTLFFCRARTLAVLLLSSRHTPCPTSLLLPPHPIRPPNPLLPLPLLSPHTRAFPLSVPCFLHKALPNKNLQTQASSFLHPRIETQRRGRTREGMKGDSRRREHRGGNRVGGKGKEKLSQKAEGVCQEKMRGESAWVKKAGFFYFFFGFACGALRVCTTLPSVA